MSRHDFRIDGRECEPEPLHYTACGLDDVYLLNGFTVEETDYGRGIAVDDVAGLHVAIGLHLVLHRKALSPKEFRFLRKQLDLTQDELAAQLGVTGQTVARWEKGETEVSGPADRLLRLFYVLSLVPRKQRVRLLKDVIGRFEGGLDEGLPHPAMFRVADGDWLEVA